MTKRYTYSFINVHRRRAMGGRARSEHLFAICIYCITTSQGDEVESRMSFVYGCNDIVMQMTYNDGNTDSGGLTIWQAIP